MFLKGQPVFLTIFPLSSLGHRGTSWVWDLSWCRWEIVTEMLHIHPRKRAERFVEMCSE